MATKKITLKVFKITCNDLKNGKSIVDVLKSRLSDSPSANERRMSINEDSPRKKEDLIANYWDRTGSAASICCSIVRVAIGNDVKQITKTLFDQKKFSINDLKNTKIEGADAIYEFDYYFGVSDRILVTNLPGRMTVTSLQTYLNWLLRPASYEITPLIRDSMQTELKDVENITFIDGEIHQQKFLTDEANKSISLSGLAWNAVKGLIVDAKDMDDVEAEKLISAKLIVTIKKERKSSSERNQNFYGALLKPIADLENIELATKSGKLVSGEDIQYIEKVDVEVEDNKFIHEEQLFQSMDKIIQKAKVLS